jgi:drug/metabolite transporter (DMT)-like permease
MDPRSQSTSSDRIPSSDAATVPAHGSPAAVARHIQTGQGLWRVAAAATMWGFVPILARGVDASPLVIAFWRVVFATAAFAAYFAIRGRLGQFRSLRGREAAATMALGLMLAAIWALYFTALTLTDVSVAVLITFTAPIFTAVFSPRLTGDPFDRRVIVPLAVALTGTIIIAAPAGIDLTGGRDLLGAGMALASAIIIGLMTGAQKRLLRRHPGEVLWSVQTGTAGLVLLPAALLLPGPSGVQSWLAAATLGLVITTFPFFLFLSGLRRARADQVAVLTYAEPVSAVVLATLLLGEPLTATVVVGGGAVVAGGLWAARLAPLPSAPEVLPLVDKEPEQTAL